MAKVPSLDIPSGLEEAYFKIVQFGSNLTQDTILLKRSSPARKNYYKVGNHSLFVLWQDLYNGLSSARHIAWTAYWGTLPFGDHSGLSQYPGSGYSAFIYANAPRYQLGLDPLLDPPAFPELLYNPNFLTALGHWSLDDGATLTDKLDFSGSDGFGAGLSTEELYELVDGGTYRLIIDVGSGSGKISACIYNAEEGLDSIIEDSVIHVDGGAGVSYIDFVYHTNYFIGDQNWVVAIFAFYLDLETFSDYCCPFYGNIFSASFKRIS